jgi:capsular polysaccharide biosynthesis protein
MTTGASAFRKARAEARRRARLAAPHILTRLPGSSERFGPPRTLAASAPEWVTQWNARCRPGDEAALVWAPDPVPIDWSPSVGPRDLDPSSSKEPIGPLEAPVHHDGLPTFALTMPRGRVAGKFGAVITPDDRLLLQATYGFVDDDRHHPIRRRFSLGAAQRLEGVAATLAYGHADAYYHWLFDVLPRLEILRLAGLDSWDHLIVNDARGATYECETLQRFGVPADRIRRLGDRTHFIADRLIVPSVVGTPVTVPTWAYQVVRDRLLPPQPPSGPPLRLYISRSDTEQRRLADEDRLIARLEPLGFTCLTLSGRPLDEQIDLFSRAEVVVGPHGGGLANLVWCRPEVAVVELFAHDYVKPVFWGLCEQLGLRHHHVIGHPGDARARPGFGEMVVDHDAVMRVTEYALSGRSSRHAHRREQLAKTTPCVTHRHGSTA